MALNLTNEQIDILKKDMEGVEPFEYDSPEMTTFDKTVDFKKWKATCAKRMLEQDTKEKAERNSNG